MPIPLFVLEEHHEAFLVWQHAIAEGLMPARANTLLHIDQHLDDRVPQLRMPVTAAAGDLAQAYALTFGELCCSDFIVPAIYLGMFDDIVWIRRDEECKARALQGRIVAAVSSPDGDGRSFSVRYRAGVEGQPLPEIEADGGHAVRYWQQTVTEPLAALRQVIVDIDLDYFSCDETVNTVRRLEVTRAEFDAFHESRYHPLRLVRGGRPTVVEEGGRYFAQWNDYPDPVPTSFVVSEAVILERLDAIVAMLERHSIRPSLIEIARSRLSGYTPADQWEFIERALVERLGTLYELEPRPDIPWSISSRFSDRSCLGPRGPNDQNRNTKWDVREGGHMDAGNARASDVLDRAAHAASRRREAERHATFGPQGYLAQYYGGDVSVSNKEFLRFYAQVYEDLGGRSLLEFGGGPSIYSLITAARTASAMHLCDYDAACLAEADKWLTGDPSAFDWSRHTSYALSCERPASDRERESERESVSTPEEIEARHRLIRERVRWTSRCDIFADDPLLGSSHGPYGVVSTAFCLEAVTQDKDEWLRLNRKLAALVDRDGLFVTITLLNAWYWVVQDLTSSLCTTLRPTDIAGMYDALGFRITHSEVIDNVDEEGYDGFMMTCGRRVR